MRVGVVLVCALLLAACGGGAHRAAGEAAKPAGQIVADAQKAAQAARTVHVSGSIAQGHGRLSLDLRIVRNVGAAGSMVLQGGSVRIVRLGRKLYLNGDSVFWKQFGSASAARRLQGRWLRVPAGTSGLGLLAQLTDLNTLFTGALRSHGKLETNGTKTYKGRTAILVKDTGSGGGDLYVAASGPPYPLAIVGASGANQGAIDFGAWNRIVTLTAPKGAVALSTLTGGR